MIESPYFFKTEDLLIWRPTGTINVNDIQSFVKFIEKQMVENKNNYLRFIDLSLIEGISVNYEELYSIAAERRDKAEITFDQIIRMAFYVTNALSFGMARMYENLLDSELYDIGIFYSLEEVANFLKVDISLLSS